ncbi:hypothetical protein LEP1GSC016_2446 [Leptospira borgpetersenii serovar Hardjo-bovis str. Sponselee]|uniref:Uncharacterized protein n=6 Tax=Leptospira borgpetersenii TaxID=174 RepID=M3FFL7_LEPBO|nr:hypothetical protein LEP1GSC128_0011 [Leptospira borgpetersenii str. 200801926]EKQ93404.1 hypothetical protein LEP1GSC101_0024 [Leptospira borgpetersenii str. UI 09149]EMG00663.1 hypothetical protein LEP1GSC123_1959 [Leptospira borgpetersenii str. 200701203]EMJ81967.1 hypothetical protein LEP1GSC016_2446 [Leptospira borgpetersenii serovar Hardjo-bovis str. Sponselee]EMK09744.1 hypothetical protein LEP1GSC066_0231 [Leptospira sp. serovar Kenya str. Sh9]EMN12031.1 hypothetical protein LEP1GSC
MKESLNILKNDFLIKDKYLVFLRYTTVDSGSVKDNLLA